MFSVLFGNVRGLVAECLGEYESEFHTVDADIRKLRSPNCVRVPGIKRSPRFAERMQVSITGLQTSPKEAVPIDALTIIPSQYGNFVADSILYREPVEDMMEDWGDVAELSHANNESRSSVQNH